jgi:hypothetical protein
MEVIRSLVIFIERKIIERKKAKSEEFVIPGLTDPVSDLPLPSVEPLY